MARNRTIKMLVLGVLISMETFVILLAIGLALWFPEFAEKIGVLFTQGWQMYCVLVGLPLGGLVFGSATLRSLLHPKDAEQKGFYKWPDYRLLRYYGYIPLVICVLAVLIAFFFLLSPQSLSAWLIGAIYLAVTFAWSVSIFTLKMAELRIDAILGGEI